MSYPNPAPNVGSSGNWNARFFSNFKDDQNRQWRVELIDHDDDGFNDFGLDDNNPEEIELTSDGFVLSYDGPTDHTAGAIIPSKVKTTFILTHPKMSLIQQVIKRSNDARFALAVYMDTGAANWTPYWVGPLVHEALEWETQDEPYLLTLTASCGLNRLRQIEYRNEDDGNPYKGRLSLAEHAARCLNKIPTIDFWMGGEFQMSEVVDVYNEEMVNGGDNWTNTQGDPFPVSVMERTFVKAQAFGKFETGDEDEFGRRAYLPPKFSSCFDVLENITNAFGTRLFLANFQFSFIPVNAYNWSHTLRLNKWTRTIVESESISTYLENGVRVDRATTENKDFRFDIEDEHALGLGWSNSYLLPVRRTALTHLYAGQLGVVGPVNQFYIDYPSSGGPTFVDPEIVVDASKTLQLLGRYDSDKLVNEFGSALTGTAYNDHGFDRIGARIVLRLKIQVGGLYYVSQYATGDTLQIDMPGGVQPDGSFNIGNPQFGGFELTVPDAQWQNDEGFYDLIIPWTSSNPPAAVLDHSNGNSYVGGLHVFTHETEDRHDYQINLTQQLGVQHEFNIETAPLPDTQSSYTGVTIGVDRIVVRHGGQVSQTHPQLGKIFQAGFAVQYDHNNADISPNFENVPGDYVADFQVGIGAQSDDADFTYFADWKQNTEILDLGDTVIQSSALGNQPNSDGHPYFLPWQYAQSGIMFLEVEDAGWYSITDTVDDYMDDTNLLTVVCAEQLSMRRTPQCVQRGEIVQQQTQSQTDFPLTMSNVIHHNCTTTNDQEDFLVPMTLTYTAGTGVAIVEAVLMESVSNFDWEGGIPDEPVGVGYKGTQSGSIIGPGQGSTNDTSFKPIRRLNSRMGVVRRDVSTINQRFRNLPSAPTESRLVLLDTNGDFDDIPDGTAGQALTTDGSGGLAFTTVSSSDRVSLANHSLTANLTKAGGLYIGDTRSGWAASDWTLNLRSNAATIPVANANCGIIIPTAMTQLSLLGSVIPATRDAITIAMFAAARPNNSSTAMSITRIGNVTVTPTTSGVPLNTDIVVRNLTLRAGSLVFIMISRAGTNVSSAITPFTFALSGQ